MGARMKRAVVALAASATLATGTAGTADAATWVTYDSEIKPGPCGSWSPGQGTVASGTVSQGSRRSYPYFVRETFAYDTRQYGAGQIAFDVRHYSQWRKTVHCESGRWVTRWQMATPVNNCYHKFYIRGFLATTAWSSGTC